MKSHKPPKAHPWRRYKAITNKPPEDKIFSAYAATSKDYKPVKKRNTKKGVGL